ncbi:conserved hypothetical protein [Culex quinquefasciatus]|uniref:Uncharacterized protein n=1 Tax=Culex quinquefasciatus TaxID=7176 RepID=B0WCU1_CULQU|nr:conserved hypothetical protein [Culex quinquefasciatus]|eukprot:XP_001846525.1 conserved hypothetical protein [Culex quinquefasciatus]
MAAPPGCFVGWQPLLLLAVLVVLQGQQLRADFGLPTAVMGGNLVVRDANGINGVLNAMDRAFRRFNPTGQTDRLMQASAVISQIALNVTELGRSVAGSVIKAASDRSTPVDELFAKLQEKYGRMSRYLDSEVQNAIETLNKSIGSAQSLSLKNALNSVAAAVRQITNSTADVGSVIARIHETTSGNTIFKAVDKASIPADLTTSLSRALSNTKDQLTGLSRTIEGMLKNIGTTNAFLARFDQTRQATEKNIVGNQQGVKAFIDGEKDTTVKRYTNTRNAIIADISNAVGKLNVFGTNQTLLALYDKHSEEYTKIYYYLFNRNESDIQNISSAFDAIGHNMEKIVVDSTRSVNSEICYNKYSGQVINTFPGYQNGVVNCMTREKNRLGRITDVMDRMLQLILSTSQDLANNVASCTVWNGFDKSETVYRQAEACLHTNINEMAKFGSIIGRELDLVQTLGDVEVAASRYRLYDCVAARNNEALATIYVLNKDIDGCVSEPGLQRDVLGGGEKGGDEDTEDPYEAGASTTEEPVYDEYLMEVFSNSSSFGDDVDKIM